MLKFFRAFLNWWNASEPEPQRTLMVNEAAPGGRTRVNVSVTVNAAAIRIELHNNRRHLVLPSYTLPDNVIMNNGLYPHDEIEKAYATLEGTFAPLSHPTLDGKFIPAGTPEAINAHHIGAFNRNVERRGDRIYVEKWVDIDYALNTEGGKALLDRVNYDPKTESLLGTPGAVHTSTGIFLFQDMTANGAGYGWTARNMVMDHDAILLNEQGAATPEQGVGLLVNSRVEDAVPLQANEVLADLSYGNLSRLLGEAATKRWGGGDKWAWVEDFDATTAVIRTEAGSVAVAYSIKNGAVEWAASEEPVEQKTEWIDKNPVVNRILQLVGLGVNSGPKPVKPLVEDASDMTPDELKAALAANNDALAATLKGVFEPLSTTVAALAANQQAMTDSLQANAKAAEAGKRAVVAEKLGQVVADALTGNALDEAHAALLGAAPIVNSFGGAGKTDGFTKTALPEA